MKRQLLLGGVAALLLVAAAMVAAPEQSVFSSGPLSEHHADIECGECHDAFTSFSSDAPCLGCHERQALTPAEIFADSRCVSCHSEHFGADAVLADVPASVCRGACHDPDTVHARAPIQLADKLDAPPRDCRRCHGSHDEHRRDPVPSIAEQRAHPVATHTRGTPLFHKDTCERCHPDMRMPTDARAASIPGFFDPHVTHVNRLDIRCTWCHQTVDIEQGSGMAFRRNVSTQRCVQCHDGEYYVAQGGAR